MAIKISNFFNYQNNNSKIGDFQDLEHIDGVSISATTANLYNIILSVLIFIYRDSLIQLERMFYHFQI